MRAEISLTVTPYLIAASSRRWPATTTLSEACLACRDHSVDGRGCRPERESCAARDKSKTCVAGRTPGLAFWARPPLPPQSRMRRWRYSLVIEKRNERACNMRSMSLMAIPLLILFAESLDVRFAVRIEEFLAAFLPRRFEFGRCDVRVRPAFLGNSTQVLAEFFHGGPTEKPIAVVDLINDETGL